MNMLKGQIDYNIKTKSWVFTPDNKNKYPVSVYKIQGRHGYFKAWAGKYTNNDQDIGKLIQWVEEKANN